MWGAFTRQTTQTPRPAPTRYRSDACMSGQLVGPVHGDVHGGFHVRCSCGWRGPDYATAITAEAAWPTDHPRTWIR